MSALAKQPRQKAQGWRIVDERCVQDGPRLLAVSVLAERPA